MPWWKLFASTFILIFIAELGDKTQLAALAKVTEASGEGWVKWLVFIAASLALILSTFIAVFFGGLIKSFFGDEKYLKIASGILFIIFGVIMLYNVFFKSNLPASELLTQDKYVKSYSLGYMQKLLLNLAADFEDICANKYIKLAQKSNNPEIVKLLNKLAEEDNKHKSSMKRIANKFQEVDIWSEEADKDDLVSLARNASQAFKSIEPSLLTELIKLEKTHAEFYYYLSNQVKIKALKKVFYKIATEDDKHAEILASIYLN